MFGIGPLELIVILAVALLVFGPKRVPELARTLGRGMAEFRRARNDLRQSLAPDELQNDLKRDLGQNQTIHRPTPGSKSAETTDAPADSAPEGKDTTATKHPSELPLGNADDHHDAPDETDEMSEGETPSEAEAKPNSPADSELGNVPVSGSNPADSRRG